MDDKDVILKGSISDDLPYDALALMTHIINVTKDKPFILIVHDLETNDTRQFSNGDPESQLSLLEQVLVGTRIAVKGRQH